MRILIHGLQGSGATFFAYFLSQETNVLGVLDYWGHLSSRCPVKKPLPYIPDEDGLDIVAKVVVSTNFPFKAHKDSFKPDITILFRRDANLNYQKLNEKWYKNEGGTIDEKFKLVQTFKDSDYDIAVNFEEFLSDPNTTLKKLGVLS